MSLTTNGGNANAAPLLSIRAAKESKRLRNLNGWKYAASNFIGKRSFTIFLSGTGYKGFYLINPAFFTVIEVHE